MVRLFFIFFFLFQDGVIRWNTGFLLHMLVARDNKMLEWRWWQIEWEDATTTQSHLIHLGLNCQSWHPIMSTSTSYNVEIQHIWQIHGCICISSSIIDHKSYPNKAAASSRSDNILWTHANTEIRKTFFSKLSFKTSSWVQRWSSSGFGNSINPQSCKIHPGHPEIFLIKTNWMEAVDASTQPCRKAVGKRRGQWPLNRSTVKHDSCMDTLWKPEIDPLLSKKRFTFNSKKDQIKGERMTS